MQRYSGSGFGFIKMSHRPLASWDFSESRNLHLVSPNAMLGKKGQPLKDHKPPIGKKKELLS